VGVKKHHSRHLLAFGLNYPNILAGLDLKGPAGASGNSKFFWVIHPHIRYASLSKT
jgi:hypothetical protein